MRAQTKRRPITGAVLAVGLGITGGTAVTVATAPAAQAATVKYCEVRAGYENTLLARFRVTTYSTRTSATIKATWYNSTNYRIKPKIMVWNESRPGEIPTTREKWWSGDAWTQQTVRTKAGYKIWDEVNVGVDLVHRRTGVRITPYRYCFYRP